VKNAIKFEWLCPFENTDFDRYKQLKKEILDVISRGYGAIAYPQTLHDYRLTQEKHFLCIARFVNSSDNIIACSYVREDGKRNGTAVLPDFRNRGIGNSLIAETLRVVPKQYGEVSVNNLNQLKLLTNNGFRVATDISEIMDRLGDFSSYIMSWDYVDNVIQYTRRSVENKGLVHKFILIYT
jgi:GNAT superfamily N-acetyltransferase